MLRDPAAKAHLLTALDAEVPRWWFRWWRPAAAAMAMAGVVVLAVVVVRNGAPKPVMVAVTDLLPAPAIAMEKERGSGGGGEPAATRADARPEARRSTAAALPAVRPPAERVARRDFRDSEADKLARAAPAAAPPPPPPPDTKADVSPVKKEAAQTKDQVSVDSAATMLADAKAAASAKSLLVRPARRGRW